MSSTLSPCLSRPMIDRSMLQMVSLDHHLLYQALHEPPLYCSASLMVSVYNQFRQQTIYRLPSHRLSTRRNHSPSPSDAMCSEAPVSSLSKKDDGTYDDNSAHLLHPSLSFPTPTTSIDMPSTPKTLVTVSISSRNSCNVTDANLSLLYLHWF